MPKLSVEVPGSIYVLSSITKEDEDVAMADGL